MVMMMMKGGCGNEPACQERGQAWLEQIMLRFQLTFADYVC